ncbi:hypothetical protein KBI23_03330 [bacterium]|nr:hypothetical protein [bacterium]MBP9807498.1 hypothetical protein [bacterium]
MPTRLFQIALIAILTLIPPIRLAYFLFTNGENCANNDDITYLEQFIRMTSSGYNWLNYFGDTFVDGHSTAFNQIVFNSYVQLGQLNQNLGAAIGIGLISIRLALFFDMIFSKTNRLRWYCLPLLSAIIFAPTGASILTQGSFAITWQLALTLGATALWAIFRRSANSNSSNPAGTKKIVLASTCIVLGSWTIATTLIIIPIVWFSAWRMRMLNKLSVLFLGTASALAIFPDLLYLERGVGTSRPLAEVLKPLDLTMFLSSLGRNFAPGTAWYVDRIAPAEVFSLLGLVLLIAICALAKVITDETHANGDNSKSTFHKYFYPSLAIASFAIGNLLLTSMVRPIIAPWYGQISLWFWIGLVGMAACLFELKSSDEKLGSGAKILAATTVISIASFCLFSPGFEDKEFFLDNRSPAYLSVLRNYQTPPPPGLLPPYKYVPLKPERLAKILEQYHLSPFGKEDTVLFQGDCVVPGLVQFRNDGTQNSELYFMSQDKKGIFTATYYKRLNLCLSGSMTVTWHVKIPDDAKVAELTTGLWQLDTINKIPDIKPNVLSIEVDSNQPLIYEMRPDEETKVKVDLLAYKGKVVTIIFTHKQNNPRTTVLEVPKVEIVRE